MKVCVVAEYYPRRRDPVLGVWAHRQALAARDAGAEIKVLALERPVPPAESFTSARRLASAVAGAVKQPRRDTNCTWRSAPPARRCRASPPTRWRRT